MSLDGNKHLLFYLILSIAWVNYRPVSAQTSNEDTTAFLKSHRINFSANNYSIQPKLPDFNTFASEFKFGNRFLTSTVSGFTEDEFTANAFYSGFMVNFVFRSNIFENPEGPQRNFFTASFESGRTENEMYRLITSDSSRLSYLFASDIFRITLGYRRILTKKEKRLKFYTGLEWVQEFNISAVILERQFDSGYIEIAGERKLFAKKAYNLYLNIPIGLDYRLFRRASLFLHMNAALGSQNSDPFRISGIFTGSRVGISLKI